MKRHYVVKAVMDINEAIASVLRGMEGVYIGAKSIVLNCLLGDNFVATAEQLKNMRVQVSHFGFDVGEYFRFVSEDKNWRKATAVCTPLGSQIEASTYKVNGGWERFSHLRHFIMVEACFFLEKGQPVCFWDVTEVGFEKDSRSGNSIKVRERKESLTMPPDLAKRFFMVFSQEDLPAREKLNCQISAYINGKNSMPAEIKNLFLKLTDVLALTYLNAWGAHEKLRVREQKPIQPTATPTTESKPEIETPAPVVEEAEETEPEAPAMVAVGGGEPIGEPAPQPDVAGMQAAAARGDKTSRGHRKPSSKGGKRSK
ncbi:hypothetical protein JW977_00850 [Candidatus Falkowbacteria bacterium]|nr:hypothetical protein [Candidatus Falkowbacteria bacterium]